MAVEALRGLRDSQADERLLAGERWQDTGLVFTTHLGIALDAGNVRKMFKRVCTAAGIGDRWTPRELRTSFVSLMSHHGVSIEEIVARLAGHASTRTTEVVYRRELRPVITTGAEIMDEVFGPGEGWTFAPHEATVLKPMMSRVVPELRRLAAGLPESVHDRP